MKIKDLQDKKIVILGFGREGVDTFNFLRRKFPKKKIAVADKNPIDELNKEAQKIIRNDERLTAHLGEGYLEALKNYQVIIKSPGVPPKLIKESIKAA